MRSNSESLPRQPQAPKPIKILSENTYNRIGSEQVIVDPSLIVKELVENSIDAKAKSVSVTLEGNKTFEKIRIRDDGYGIPRDNLPLLCRRFATTKFDDDYDFALLESLGYRGEALNFISMNAKILIASKSLNARLGYKAEFKDGTAIRSAKAANGASSDPVSTDPNQGQGTKIEISEIFFNNVKRREELNFIRDSEQIVKLVWKLSFHYRTTFFAVCRNETLLFKNEFIDDEKAYFASLINFRFNKRLTAGDFTLAERHIDEEHLKLKLFFSDPAIDLPKKTVILFVNGRLCHIDSFEKAVAAAYKTVSTSVNELNKSFFCYLDLVLDTSSADNHYIDVNSCPKKQNLVLKSQDKLADFVRSCLEKLLKEYRSAITYKESTKQPNRREMKEESGDQASYTAPYHERSDPNRIKLSAVFASELRPRKVIGSAENCVSDETKKDFLISLVHFSDAFLDFFKKVELVGIKNGYTILVQYETLLLQLDARTLLRKHIEYRLLISDRYNITGEITIDLASELKSILDKGISVGLVSFSSAQDEDSQRALVYSRLQDNLPLLNNLGCSLDGEILKIKTFDFLDHFEFYAEYFFFFILKVTSGEGSPREAAELLGYYFLLGVDAFSSPISDSLKGLEENKEGETQQADQIARLEALRFYYDLLLLEAKREEFCTEIDFGRDLDPIVDLEHTYKTFERC